ncbi:MAG: hypothetical protein KAW09_09025 [Thermoplasmata archaeon]|nr:hypothetical protein [Thermoplasmata archaeon]
MTEGESTINTAALAFLAISVVVIVLGLVWASVMGENIGGGMMGHQGGNDSSSTTGSLIVTIGILLLIVSVIAMFLLRPKVVYVREERFTPMPHTSTELEPGRSNEEMQQLAIRLLTGDERKMFRRIVDAGGEILQRELVAEGIFSKAKVTRVLDKLERKSLITRERYGSTNKVRISQDIGK